MYGKRIRELRKEHNLTQDQLAQYLGTTQKSISKYEIEKIDISTNTIIKLCELFKVSADYLLGITNDY